MPDPLSHLTGSVPLVLLPARVETRWDVTSEDAPVLLIRVYPDEINASGHQAGLSADEIAAGESWWAGRSADEPEAWRLLRGAVGAPRAAWIARTFFEARESDSGAPIRARTRVEPAQAHALPARWIAVGYAEFGGSLLQVFEVAGADIGVETLQLSPSRAPSAEEGLVEPALAWLTDFAEAVKVGMGLRVRRANLSTPAWWETMVCANGLGRLLVIGVPRSGPAQTHVAALRALLERHHYSSGLAVVPPGTPTNNTSAAVSGYSSKSIENGPFDHERNLGSRSHVGRCDSVWACSSTASRPAAERRWTSAGARALGGLGLVPPAPAWRTFVHTSTSTASRWAPLSNLASQSTSYAGLSPAEATRALLFPGLLGRTLRLGYTVPVQDIADVWLHFARDVAPEGSWPTLRRGKVPYAVMPVSALPSSYPADPWRSDASEQPAGLEAALARLWGKVRQAGAGLSCVGDQDAGLKTLGRVLSQGAFSHGLVGLESGHIEKTRLNTSDLILRDALLARPVSDEQWSALVEARYEAWRDAALDDDPFAAWMERPWPLAAHNVDIPSVDDAQRSFDLSITFPFEHAVCLITYGSSDEYGKTFIYSYSQLRPFVTSHGGLSEASRREVANAMWAHLIGPALTSDLSPLPVSWRYAFQEDPDGFRAAWIAGLREESLADAPMKRVIRSINKAALKLLLRDALTDALAGAASLDDTIDLLKSLFPGGGLWWSRARGAALQIERSATRQGALNPIVSLDGDDSGLLKGLLSALGSCPDELFLVTEFGPPTHYGPGLDEITRELGGLRSWFGVLALQSLLECARILEVTVVEGRLVIPSQGQAMWRLWLSAAELLATPEKVSREERERLMLQTVDACSHRLDPWLSSLAHRRLERLDVAADGADNRYLGAYAWVHDLPAPPSSPRAQKGTGGFIHAPSLNAAMAAAVLRSPALDEDNEGEPLFVDLDAGRARLARALLLGVRNGVPLPAILGQRLERDLCDGDLERWIAPLRRAFPLDPPEDADDEQDLSPVVDGLALARFWRERSAGSGWGSDELTTLRAAVSSQERTRVADALKALVGALDAVSDLMVAEGIYQAVLGNTDRAAAALASMDGEGDPPTPQLLDSPRSGSPLGFQVLLSLGGTSSVPAGWPSRRTPRATAEPTLNRWLGERLSGLSVPNPNGLHPIDVLALVTEVRTSGSSEALRAALGANGPLASEILDRLLPVAELLETARPLNRDDLRRAGLIPGGPAVLDARISALRAMVPALPGAGDAIEWGLKGKDATAWAAELRTRLEAFDAAAPPADADAAAMELAHLDQIRALLGGGVIVVPAYSVTSASAVRTVSVAEEELSVWLGQAARTHEGLDRWWLWRLGDPATSVAVMQTALSGDSMAVQAGFDPGRWIGLGISAATDKHRDAIVKGLAGSQSLIVDGPWPSTGNKLTALRVDGWVERIPIATTTTGVAFHYDDAGAEAPQAILVAVPPDPKRATWSLEHLQRTLTDTLELARARGVTPDELAGLGQLVPPLSLSEARSEELFELPPISMINVLDLVMP